MLFFFSSLFFFLLSSFHLWARAHVSRAMFPPDRTGLGEHAAKHCRSEANIPSFLVPPFPLLLPLPPPPARNSDYFDTVHAIEAAFDAGVLPDLYVWHHYLDTFSFPPLPFSPLTTTSHLPASSFPFQHLPSNTTRNHSRGGRPVYSCLKDRAR